VEALPGVLVVLHLLNAKDGSRMTFLDLNSFANDTQNSDPFTLDTFTPGSSTASINSNLEPVIRFPELLLVESKLHDSFLKADGIIKDLCSKLLSSGGKRIRPLLTLQSAQCFGPLNTSTIQASVAAELIHMASLIHDDVIDRSNLRRGLPTVNFEHGNQIAVLTGDYVFAEAFHILSSENLLSSMSYLVQAIQAMCAGEVAQAGERFNLSTNRENYFKRIAQKTGILLESCCRSGAATAGASKEDIERLGEYGLNLGYAYQIIDDILDFTGNPKETGKPVAADLINGYITLPVINLLENPLYGPWAHEILLKRALEPNDVQKIIQALISSEALDEAFTTAFQCAQTALDALEPIPPSPAKTYLSDLTYTVLYRRA
jgi:heptaprenyl diphosphate synthase